VGRWPIASSCPSVRLKKARPGRPAPEAERRAGASAEDGGGRRFCIARNSAPPFHKELFLALFLGAEGENRRAKPLLADRVGLKPRITEGHERATGLVAAFRERETRRIFGEWRSHIGRDARPKGEIRFAPLSWKAPPLPPLLEGVAESVALAPISACSRIGSAPVPPSLRSQAHGRSRLGHSPSQRQGDRHTRAQAVGGSPRRRGWHRPFLC
jgi:hypothetical protein